MQSVRSKSILRALRSKVPSERASAALTTGEMGLKGAIPILRFLLQDKSPEVRMRAVQSLGSMGRGPSICLEIAKRLHDSDELVRAEAATALQVLGASQALPDLTRRLKDPSPIVRSFAASSIGSLGSKAYVALLLQGYNREKVSNARIGYLAGLYKLGCETCFVALVAFLKSADYHDMFAAANTLLEISTRRDRRRLATILPFLIKDEPDKFRRGKLKEVVMELKSDSRR